MGCDGGFAMGRSHDAKSGHVGLRMSVCWYVGERRRKKERGRRDLLTSNKTKIKRERRMKRKKQRQVG